MMAMDTRTKIIDVSSSFGFGRVRFSPSAIDAAGETENLIYKLKGLIPDGWPVGYERNLTRFSIDPNFDIDDPGQEICRIVPDFRSRPRKSSDSIFERPEVELCLYNVWQKEGLGPHFKAADLEYISGRLSVDFRVGPIGTGRTETGYQIVFSKALDVPKRMECYLGHFNQSPCPGRTFLGAVESYYNFLVIHPLRDGNGYMARALLQLYLNRHLGLKAPILPIGPIYFENLLIFQLGYLKWALEDDGDFLLFTLCRTMNTLCDFFIDNYARLK